MDEQKTYLMTCKTFRGEEKYKLIWRESLELELLEKTLGGKIEVRSWEDFEFFSSFFASMSDYTL